LDNLDKPNKKYMNRWITDFHCYGKDDGNVYIVCITTGDAIYNGSASDIVNGFFQKTMDDIGKAFESGTVNITPMPLLFGIWGFDMLVALPSEATNIQHYKPQVVDQDRNIFKIDFSASTPVAIEYHRQFTLPYSFSLSLQNEQSPVTIRIECDDDDIPGAGSPVAWCFTFELPEGKIYDLGLTSKPVSPTPGKIAGRTAFLDLIWPC